MTDGCTPRVEDTTARAVRCIVPARANPFRSVRVTTLAWRGDAVGDLWTRLESHGRRAAIVGPHGSGKTTLLEALAADAPDRGLDARLLRLGGAPRRPGIRVLAGLVTAGHGTLLAIDGCERLSPAGRTLLGAVSRGAYGLLVTRHRAGWLPTLLETATSPELLADLADELLPGGASRLGADLPELWLRHHGNLRACLGELYDRAARPRAPGRSGFEPGRHFVSGFEADI